MDKDTVRMLLALGDTYFACDCKAMSVEYEYSNDLKQGFWYPGYANAVGEWEFDGFPSVDAAVEDLFGWCADHAVHTGDCDGNLR